MLYCFLKSQACRLLLAADYAGGPEEIPADMSAPLYVGVEASPGTSPVLAGHLLALLAGQALPEDKDACNKLDTPVSLTFILFFFGIFALTGTSARTS